MVRSFLIRMVTDEELKYGKQHSYKIRLGKGGTIQDKTSEVTKTHLDAHTFFNTVAVKRTDVPGTNADMTS